MRIILLYDQHTPLSRSLAENIPESVIGLDCLGVAPVDGIRALPSLVAFDTRDAILLIQEIDSWDDLAAFQSQATALETAADADWAEEVQAKADTEDLGLQITAQIIWLQDKITNWDTLTMGDKDAVLKRVAQIEIESLRAWRFVIRRLT